MSKRRNIYRVALVMFFVVPALGCQGIRSLTYPQHFVWLGSSEVSSTMQSMANSMYTLDDLISRGSEVKGQQNRILVEIEKIETLAESISPKSISPGEQSSPAPVTNHLLIDDNIDDFLNDVARAKLQVQADPPNYYVVGQLIGGCNSCHRQR